MYAVGRRAGVLYHKPVRFQHTRRWGCRKMNAPATPDRRGPISSVGVGSRARRVVEVTLFVGAWIGLGLLLQLNETIAKAKHEDVPRQRPKPPPRNPLPRNRARVFRPEIHEENNDHERPKRDVSQNRSDGIQSPRKALLLLFARPFVWNLHVVAIAGHFITGHFKFDAGVRMPIPLIARV